jgi:hypothetical protein
MVHTLLVKKLTLVTTDMSNQLVQNDKMIFLTLVQIGYFLTRFANKKNHVLSSAMRTTK